MELERTRETLARLTQYVKSGMDDLSAIGYAGAEQEWQRFVIVREYEQLVLLNYSDATAQLKSWPDVLRVCRGIVLERNTGELVSLPLVKFFNLNEQQETEAASIANLPVRSVTDKIDGVMIQLFRYGEKLVWASRHGIATRAAQIAEQLAQNSIRNLVKRIPYERWTLVMELVHPGVWQPGMVYPTEPALYPLYLRDLNTLELIPACELYDTQQLPYPFRLANLYGISKLSDAIEVAMSASDADWEGVVLQYRADSGNLLVKLKSPLYLQRLAAVRKLTPSRLLLAYEENGWHALHQLLSPIEELYRYKPFRELLQLVMDTEQQLRQQMQRYLQVERAQVASIPEEWRWTVGYRAQPQKLEHALRRMVAKQVKQCANELQVKPYTNELQVKQCTNELTDAQVIAITEQYSSTT